MTRLVDPLKAGLVVAPATVWNGFSGDFAVAPASNAASPAGLLADAPLLTAIALCLFSDVRGEADPLDPASIDLRGWPGDGFDLAPGEAPLGSKAWMLQRLPVNDATARKAEAYMRDALAPLLAQKILGSAEVQATPYPALRRIDLVYTLRRVDGSTLVTGPWAGLWEGLKGYL